LHRARHTLAQLIEELERAEHPQPASRVEIVNDQTAVGEGNKLSQRGVETGDVAGASGANVGEGDDGSANGARSSATRVMTLPRNRCARAICVSRAGSRGQ
jgi:hypothetical protein